MLFAATIATASLGLVSAAIGPVTDLHITNADLALDGFPRSGTYAESVFPGPLIVGNKGDNFKINVINELTDPSMLLTTSIHWHGLFQRNSNWADGPSFVNQCPIAPGAAFEYDFSVPDQAGTFWYHSHHGTQYCDGLRGPLVVYDSNDPHAGLYDVDDESTVITLSDWYHLVSLQAQAAGRPIMDSTLINGAGRYNGGPSIDLAVVNVVQGLRYRMRLIAMSCAPNWVFSIEKHQLEIIEADGENTERLVVDSIQIFAGQRYSFVLNANQTIDNYWIHADPNEGDSGFENGLNSAILRYSGAPIAEPAYVNASDVVSLCPLKETDLHALNRDASGVAGGHTIDGADKSLSLVLGFNLTNHLFTVNGATYSPPTVPVMLQIMSGAFTAQDLLPAGSVYPLPKNKTIQISILPGQSVGTPHPFHMHGHSFDVIRSAGSDLYNYDNPVRRDVVSTGGNGDNVTVRFTTDNAGPWFLHCHIDWHLDTGLAVVLAEDPEDAASENPVPESWDDLCPAYNALTPAQLGGIIPSPSS